MIAVILASAAVLAIGDDAARAGSLQRALESRASETIGAAEIAALREKTHPAVVRPGVDAAWRKRADELATRIAREYYEGRLDDALVTIAGLDAHLAAAPHAPAKDRVTLLLWRVAVFLERGERDAAPAPGVAALAIDPALAVDEKVFPPSVTRLVAELRAKPAPTATVTLSVLPARAVVLVDDKPRVATPPSWRLPLGRHRVAIGAPGYEWVVLDLDVTADVAFAVPLPPAVDPAARDALQAAMRRGAADAAEAERIAALASSLGADTLAVAGVFGSRIYGLVADGRRVEVRAAADDGPASETATLEWLAKRVRPRLLDTRRAPALGLHVDGFLASGVRVRSLSGGQGGDVTSGLPSAGPLLRATFTRGRIAAEAEAAWALSPDTVEVRLADGSTENGGGGSTTRARVAGGVRHPAAGEGTTFAATAGLAWERHASRDVVGLFAGYERIALEIGAGASIPARAAQIDIALRATPFGLWSDSPRGMTGGSPRVEPGLALRAGASVPRGAWRLSALAEAERRAVRFRGAGGAPIDPPLDDARLEETVLFLAISFGRSF